MDDDLIASFDTLDCLARNVRQRLDVVLTEAEELSSDFQNSRWNGLHKDL